MSIEERIATVCGHLNALHGELVTLVADALDGDLWRGDGLRSIEHWLTIQAGISYPTARRIAEVARRRGELPTVIGRLSAGTMTLDQAAVVAALVPAHNDADVADFAEAATVTQLRATLRRYPFDHPIPEPDVDDGAETADTAQDGETTEPETSAVPEPLPDNRRCGWFFDDDGTFHLHLTADADEGALVDTALTAARARLYNSGASDVTNVDAFVEMANQSLNTTETPGPLDRMRVHVHLDTHGAFVHHGPQLPAHLLEQLLCDGVLRPIWEVDGHPINVGRDQRVVPERTRHAIEHRDDSCRYPGCGRQRHLEIHHIIHWRYDGVTDTWNLIALCPHHHRAHHRGEFHITGNADIPDHTAHADRLRFTRSDGTEIRDCQRPHPPVGPPPTPTGPFRHPTGETFDPTLISWPNRDGTYQLSPLAPDP